MENNVQIREAINKVNLEGILKELKLEAKDDVISGDIVILTSPNSEHTVTTYVNRLTKSNTENKAYKGLQTVMRDFVSVAALMSNKEDPKTYEEAVELATKVRINNAKLGRNEFYVSGSGEFVSNVSVNANFFNHITDDSFTPKAEFEIECYVEKIRKEIKKDEETGRLILDTIIPLYGGRVIPMEFVADGDVAEYLENNYEERKTCSIWGDLINVVERTTEKKSGFGKDKETVKANYKRELLITGGAESQYDEDNKNAYTTDQIKEAWKVRETEYLPEMLKKSQDKSKGANKSGGSTKPAAPKFNF